MTPIPILIQGMHGLGDNVHQRAVIRHLLADGETLWLKTPWPCLFHDLVGDRLRLLDPGATLRTQRKNSSRERDRYAGHAPPPAQWRALRVWYDYGAVRATGSFLAGMIKTTLRRDASAADTRLPVPPAWRAKADALIGHPRKPVMVLRPLVERTEWAGCKARNPDWLAYAALFNSIRDRFHVVSIADLVPRVEWLVGPPLDADVRLHAG
jgi:hypothetical protein